MCVDDQEVPRHSVDHPQHPEKVQTIFKKVWKKHHYQREKKRFVTPDHPAHPENQKEKTEDESLLQEDHEEDHEDLHEDSDDHDPSEDFEDGTSQSLIDSDVNSISNSTGWRKGGIAVGGCWVAPTFDFGGAWLILMRSIIWSNNLGIFIFVDIV